MQQQTPPVDGDWEEDVEAELYEFMLVSRLGADEEAHMLAKDVLWSHLTIFPVFAEVAYFSIVRTLGRSDTGDIEKLSSWIDDHPKFTQSTEESNFVRYIMRVCSFIKLAIEGSAHNDFFSIQEQSAQLERPCEIMRHTLNLMLLIGISAADGVSRLIEDWRSQSPLLDGESIHEAAETLVLITNLLSIDTPLSDIRKCSSFLGDIVACLFVETKTNAKNVGTEGSEVNEQGSARALVWVHVAFAYMQLRRLRSARTTHAVGTTTSITRDLVDGLDGEVLISQAFRFYQRLFEELPDTKPRGKYLELFEEFFNPRQVEDNVMRPRTGSIPDEISSVPDLTYSERPSAQHSIEFFNALDAHWYDRAREHDSALDLHLTSDMPQVVQVGDEYGEISAKGGAKVLSGNVIDDDGGGAAVVVDTMEPQLDFQHSLRKLDEFRNAKLHSDDTSMSLPDLVPDQNRHDRGN